MANSWFNCWRFWLSRFIQRVSSSQRLPFTTPRMRPPLRKNVELVIHDPAIPSPLFDAVGKRPPHIHASRFDALPLTFRQLRSEKLIERFLLAILSEPQGLAGLQVANHGDEFHLLAEVDLIHTHLC